MEGFKNVFNLIHGQNFRVRLLKDQPRALEDDPCKWSQTLSMIRVWIDGALFPIIDNHLEMSLKLFNIIVSDKKNGCAARKGTVTVDSQTDRHRGLVCKDPFSCTFLSWI